MFRLGLILLLAGCVTTRISDESLDHLDRILEQRINQLAVTTGMYMMSPDRDRVLEKYEADRMDRSGAFVRTR